MTYTEWLEALDDAPTSWPTERLPIVDISGARITASQLMPLEARTHQHGPTRGQVVGGIMSALAYGVALALTLVIVVAGIVLVLTPPSVVTPPDTTPSTQLLGVPNVGTIGSATTSVEVTPPTTVEPTRSSVVPTSTLVPSTTTVTTAPITTTTVKVLGVAATPTTGVVPSTTGVVPSTTGVGTTGVGVGTTVCPPPPGPDWVRTTQLGVCEWGLNDQSSTTQPSTDQSLTTQSLTTQPLTTDSANT